MKVYIDIVKYLWGVPHVLRVNIEVTYPIHTHFGYHLTIMGWGNSVYHPISIVVWSLITLITIIYY